MLSNKTISPAHWATLLTIFAVAFVACSPSSTPTSVLTTAAPTQAPVAEPAATASQATHVIDTARGKVTIPINPQRVVALSAESLSALLDVGFTPMGVSDGAEAWVLPKYATTVQAIEKVGEAPEANLEKVAALQPDLIVSANVPNDDFYARLSAIAPTVFIDTASTSWEQYTAAFASAVGRDDGLETVQQQYQAHLASLRSNYANVLESTRWGIVNSFDANWNLFFIDSPGGAVLDSAGVQFISEVEGQTSGEEYGFRSLSYERLDLFSDADVLLVFDSTPETPRAANQALMDAAVFQALEAAKNDHVFLSAFAYPSSYGEALALLDEIEQICKALQTGG